MKNLLQMVLFFYLAQSILSDSEGNRRIYGGFGNYVSLHCFEGDEPMHS